MVCGVAINDADYEVYNKLQDGSLRKCPFYVRWVSMIRRCYSSKVTMKNPTYVGCRVCDDWLTFSKFREWMTKQDWEGKHLDKDLIVKGNQVYNPDTCVFISQKVNVFITDITRGKGQLNLPTGVVLGELRSDGYRYIARISYKGKSKNLGQFRTPNSAHAAWLTAKRKFANELADDIDDERVANALRLRY